MQIALAIGCAGLIAKLAMMGEVDRERKNKGPLVLENAGSFYVNGKKAVADYSSPGGTAGHHIVVDQMYVEYLVPSKKRRNSVPVVMVPGSGHTTKTYGETPDGREGWASYFTRKGFSVYLVDQVGRAMSSFDPGPVNQAFAKQDITLLPTGFNKFSYERAWTTFRIGPEPFVPYGNTQFPVDALDQYMAQVVPNTERMSAHFTEANVAALASLLEKIGPAAVLVHSQSASFIGRLVSGKAPVRGIIDVEGSAACFLTPDEIQALRAIPFVFVLGDRYPQRATCSQAVETMKAAGSNARLLDLTEIGFFGNGHMLMMERNNLEIADVLVDWIDEHVVNRQE